MRAGKKGPEPDSRHPLYDYSTTPGRLKYRKSFLRTTQIIQDRPPKGRSKLWEERYPPPHDFIKSKEQLPLGGELQVAHMKALYRLRTQVGRCKYSLVKWGVFDPSNTRCECVIVQTCPVS